MKNPSVNPAQILLNQFKSVFTNQTDQPLPPVKTPCPNNIHNVAVTTQGVEKPLRDLKPHAPTPYPTPY